MDLIDRQAVLDAFEKYSGGSFAYGCVWDYVKNLPSVKPQPEEDCDTCKHKYFETWQCVNCRGRCRQSHYERRYEQDG